MTEQKVSIPDRLAGLGRKLLLLDGAGALLSAVMLGGLLASRAELVGVSRGVLHALAGMAVVFAVISLSSYRWAGRKWYKWLRVMGWVNVAYCALTLTLMCLLHETLSWPGAAYFILEIALVLTLARVELKAAKQETIL